MKRTLNTALLVLSLAGIFAQSTHAGIATPNGIFKITLAAGNNFIATPFARSEEGVGTITAQTGSTLTVSPISGPNSYVADAYGSGASEPYILEILDGEWIGYSAPISSNTSTTITLPSGAPPLLWVQSMQFASIGPWNRFLAPPLRVISPQPTKMTVMMSRMQTKSV